MMAIARLPGGGEGSATRGRDAGYRLASRRTCCTVATPYDIFIAVARWAGDQARAWLENTADQTVVGIVRL